MLPDARPWYPSGSWFAFLALVICLAIIVFFRPEIDRPAGNFPLTHSGLSASSSLLPPIVFVSRNPIPGYGPDAVPGIGPVFRTFYVGGWLMVREPSGRVRLLVDTLQFVDVSDPSVSWDGAHILFSGLVHPDSNWRIFRIRSDGTDLQPLTHSDRYLDLSQFGKVAHRFARYDDFDPCFLPDGRIMFASTRFPSIALLGDVLTSNLFLMNADGSGMRRITSERNGGEEPSIDPVTGKVAYSRWFVNMDRPSNITKTGVTREESQALTNDIANLWQASTINPDGDELKLYAGFVRTREGTHAYKPVILPDTRLVSMFTSNLSMLPTTGGSGLRWFAKGAGSPRHIVGTSQEERPSGVNQFAVDPALVQRNRLLFSRTNDDGDYGLFTIDLDGKSISRVLDFPGRHELDAQPLVSRPLPPILEDDFPFEPSLLPPTEDPQTYFKDDFFRFDCMNVFTNGAVDEPIPDAPRITRGARIRFFMNVQRQSATGPDPSIFLKDAEVFYHGGVHEHDVPAEVPLFEQLVDSNGHVLETSDGRFAHVPGFNFERQGAGTKCVGCHAGHSMLEVPINGTIAEWFNVSPSASVSASSFVKDMGGRSYPPEQVVDRQAQTGGDSVIWVANEGVGASIELRWDIPIEVREMILYSISPGKKIGNPVVNDCEILLYYYDKQVFHFPSTGRVSPKGTPVRVPPTVINSARIVIKKFSGRIHRQAVVGLAEVETIARLVRLDDQL